MYGECVLFFGFFFFATYLFLTVRAYRFVVATNITSTAAANQLKSRLSSIQIGGGPASGFGPFPVMLPPSAVAALNPQQQQEKAQHGSRFASLIPPFPIGDEQKVKLGEEVEEASPTTPQHQQQSPPPAYSTATKVASSP